MAIARYTLAVDRRQSRNSDNQQSADFIPCVAFGKLAEFAEKYLAQGVKIVIEGHLQSGSYTIHSYTTQPLDNGYIRFTIEYTAPKGMRVAAFNPPNGDILKLFGANTSDKRESQSFDLKVDDVHSVESITISFSFSDNDRFFVFSSTVGL